MARMPFRIPETVTSACVLGAMVTRCKRTKDTSLHHYTLHFRKLTQPRKEDYEILRMLTMESKTRLLGADRQSDWSMAGRLQRELIGEKIEYFNII